SSHGPTMDGLQKPELIAPGIWLAAPMLPGTPTADHARLLTQLEAAKDQELGEMITDNAGLDADLDEFVQKSLKVLGRLDTKGLRRMVWIKVRDNNVINSHYKHVDGTSFAAPIVASVAAQMLEARPGLSPANLKFALIKTARRLPEVD